MQSAGTGDDRSRDGRKDYTDKSDPIRDYDCIWCMAAFQCARRRQSRSTSQTRSIMKGQQLHLPKHESALTHSK
jgi:hypothetical protein